jgi:hypothetical protein
MAIATTEGISRAVKCVAELTPITIDLGMPGMPLPAVKTVYQSAPEIVI